MALASKASVASRSSVRATFRPVTAPRRFSQVVRAQETAVTSKVLDVTDKTFSAEVLKSAEPVLVDFWAPWCGPCRMIAPLVDEIAAEYSGKVKCVKINTDESPDVATDYGVRSIPTVMIFKGGKKLDTIIGAVPKNTLVQTVNKYL